MRVARITQIDGIITNLFTFLNLTNIVQKNKLKSEIRWNTFYGITLSIFLLKK